MRDVCVQPETVKDEDRGRGGRSSARMSSGILEQSDMYVTVSWIVNLRRMTSSLLPVGVVLPVVVEVPG